MQIFTHTHYNHSMAKVSNTKINPITFPTLQISPSPWIINSYPEFFLVQEGYKLLQTKSPLKWLDYKTRCKAKRAWLRKERAAQCRAGRFPAPTLCAGSKISKTTREQNAAVSSWHPAWLTESWPSCWQLCKRDAEVWWDNTTVKVLFLFWRWFEERLWSRVFDTVSCLTLVSESCWLNRWCWSSRANDALPLHGDKKSRWVASLLNIPLYILGAESTDTIFPQCLPPLLTIPHNETLFSGKGFRTGCSCWALRAGQVSSFTPAFRDETPHCHQLLSSNLHPVISPSGLSLALVLFVCQALNFCLPIVPALSPRCSGGLWAKLGNVYWKGLNDTTSVFWFIRLRVGQALWKFSWERWNFFKLSSKIY